MAMQSFRGAGGVGAISLRRKTVRDASNEYELRPITQELLTTIEDDQPRALVHASTAVAVAAGALVAAWVLNT
jgi:hypothetical protein